ncbi:MAG: SpoIIE family protein phosphatase [Tepidisphaeraceae bacterium]
MTPALRIVHADDAIQTKISELSPVADQALTAEIESLHQELKYLRQRDETLNFYMERLDEELRLAARLQQDFLPKQLPQIGPVQFHTLFRPASYVSGDLYDVFRLDETHVGFFMADAVGHGMPAALLTMFIKNAIVTKQINSDGYRLLDPSEVLGALNNRMVEQNLTQATFATAVYATIDASTLQLKYARAGHPLPLLMRASGEIICLDSLGGLLGIFPDEVYSLGQMQLQSGDRLFVYSDGIEVAFAADQESQSSQWRAELQRRRDMPTEQLLSELTAMLDGETGSLSPKDDLSMIIMEVK